MMLGVNRSSDVDLLHKCFGTNLPKSENASVKHLRLGSGPAQGPGKILLSSGASHLEAKLANETISQFEGRQVSPSLRNPEAAFHEVTPETRIIYLFICLFIFFFLGGGWGGGGFES